MQYEDRIVCFIDILGFKDHIKKSDTDIKKVQAIADALHAIRRDLDIDNPNIEERDGATITQFSDSIVISFKSTETGGVFFTLLKLIWVQATLVNHGMLARGAIVRGDLVHNEEILFGPGFVKAYEAESKAAMYPRIILGSDVLHIALNYGGHHPMEEAKSLDKLIIKDSDGMYFIDYLGQGVEEEFDDPANDYILYLEKIRDIIDENIKTDDVSIRIKYGWLLSRHNGNIAEIAGQLRERDIDPYLLKANDK